MADFDAALAVILRHEGGYVFDPLDRGGETWRGVSRRAHPDWPGWASIDRLRGHENFPAILDRDAALVRDVADLYRRRFWDRIQGDTIPSQAVAIEVFEQAVNFGVGPAVLRLQESLNALNRNARIWPDVREDGDLGPATMAALRACCVNTGDSANLVRCLNVLQGAAYVAIARRNPTQERFLNGWLARVGV